MSHWSQDYIGIPHAPHGKTREGVNCWTLAVLVYGEQLAIQLPAYVGDFVSIDEAAEIETLFADEAAIRWSEVDTPAEFDLAIFRRGRFETHVGIVVRPGLMLHVVGEDQAKLERYDNGVWKPRLKRFLRHFERLQVAA
ncbi:C40 family peptidase [Agrobacterium vitis]|uniref:NlpC/P60 family protein n=1 Tax=Agrobacterium vitis TaxID=373 RepID=UPI0015747617|nr:NlpC/P60 family protein [Agrobacterium vitis]NSZ48440.1 C40 family peptidase [Agrobacterium vitis]UJL73036.1 C40 family peptidase [Agrobacterium vitis]